MKVIFWVTLLASLHAVNSLKLRDEANVKDDDLAQTETESQGQPGQGIAPINVIDNSDSRPSSMPGGGGCGNGCAAPCPAPCGAYGMGPMMPMNYGG